MKPKMNLITLMGSQTMDPAKNAYQRQTNVLEHQDLSLLGKEMVVGPQIKLKMK